MKKILTAVALTAVVALAACKKEEAPAPAVEANAEATQPADAPAVEMPAEEKTEAKN